MNTQIKQSYDEDILDLRVIVARLMARRWWIAISVLLSTAVFIFAAFTITPVYRASVLLVPASSERANMNGSLSAAFGQITGLASLVGGGIGGGDIGTEEALAVLRSRQFTWSFITDKQLMPVLFPKQWDAKNGKWTEAASQPTPSSAYQYFNNLRSVIQDKKTGLVTLQVDWADRNAAADWANALVARLNAEMRSRAIAKADASLGYLQKELASTSILEIREAINRLIEAQIKQRMLASVTQEYSFRVLDKAIAPDSSDRLKPNKRLLVIMGPMVGLTIGVMIILLSNFIGRFRQ